ncbi:MAG: nicotinamide mononucleotide transporter [Elusimicrobia bacterium]|nr:nicotinamide mononucleotide transporter [Elusimicrobiota bacterium]
MMRLLSVHEVFFTVLGYPMSYLEFFGTALNVLAVWLMTRRNLWAWPIGIAAVALFAALFYQIRLYADLLEQAYYLGTGFWGWWLWSRGSRNAGERGLPVGVNTPRVNAILGAGVLAATGALGWLTARLHLLAPAWFPAAASFPYLDAFTTAMSFAAQLLTVYRRLENWHLWIAVDAISVALYWQKDVKLVALLYFVFLVLAVKGLLAWRAELAGESVDPLLGEGLAAKGAGCRTEAAGRQLPQRE